MTAVAALHEYMWFDGALTLADDIAIRPFTHALHYGSGVFEGIRAYETGRGTGVFRLREHLRRLRASAETYGLAIAYDERALANAVFDTLEANAFTAGYIRPLVYFGQRGISLAPALHCPTHVLIALKALSGSLIGTGDGLKTTISPWQKTPSKSLPSTVKACGHYTNSILALHDAQRRGFDEAILLNDRGDVAEGTGENVFVVKNDRLKTNDRSADVLEGITAATVVELARDRGLIVNVGPISVRDLFEADEVFFTGTAAEVVPIAQIDDRRLPSAHTIADELGRAYAAAVRGKDSLHLDWVERDLRLSLPSIKTSAG